jgi:hypothetical protein
MKQRLVPLCLALLLVSCGGGGDVSTEIVGYWKGDVVPQDLRFSADGKVEIVDHKHSTYRGTYRLSEGNVLTCDIDHNIFNEPLVFTAKVEGETLILDTGGRGETYHRVQ